MLQKNNLPIYTLEKFTIYEKQIIENKDSAAQLVCINFNKILEQKIHYFYFRNPFL